VTGRGPWTALLAGLLAAACARIEPPPGGPPDERPPRILRVEPAPGSVDQPGDVAVRIVFDEHVDRASTVADLIVSPPPPGGLRTRWSGRALKIRFGGELPPDRSHRRRLSAWTRVTGARMARWERPRFPLR